MHKSRVKEPCDTMTFASLYFNELVPISVAEKKYTNITAPAGDSMKLQNIKLRARASEAWTLQRL